MIYRIVIGTALLLSIALPAAAEDDEFPKYEVFAGYGYVRPQGGQANLNGWHTSLASNVNNWFGLAVELSGQYGSQTLTVSSGGRTSAVKANVDFHSLGFGPRFTYRRSQRMSPFAHALFGVARGNWRGPAAVAGEESSFGMALGGGIDTKFSRHVGLRLIQAEYVRTQFGVHPEKNIRIATGLLFSF